MLHYGPFKGIENAWDDEDFARFIAHLVGTGIYPNPSTNLQVMQNVNMTVVVKPGAAWIKGRLLFSDGDIELKLDNADGVLKRIDRVVIRVNYAERKIDIVVKKGSFASSPVAPVLQRDADYYELALADVLINNGAVEITQVHITDTRLNKELCGIAEGLIKQVDTTTIFNQYQAWYEQFTEQKATDFDVWQAQEKVEFEDWVASLKNILDGDVAANLTNRIITLETIVGNEELETNAQTLKGAINEVKQLGNSVKQTLVDELLLVDPSLPITSDSSWAEILAIIGTIETGRKWATGNVINPFPNTSVTVNDLSFKPTLIIISIGANGNSVLGHIQGYYVYNKSLSDTQGRTYQIENISNPTPVTVYDDGFYIANAGRASNVTNTYHTWYAFE